MWKPDEYSYRVVWSVDRGRHIGLVDEFPDLAWAATTQVGALDGIRKSVIEALRRLGDDAPMPHSQREYSGKFLVRTTPRVHRRLSERAAREGRSLNALVNEMLDQ